jgi:hypothetical protein
MALEASEHDLQQQAMLERLEQQVRSFCRTRTWKQVERYLQARQHDLQTQAGQCGLTDSDRAMLQGKIAMILEVRLHLPTAMVQESLALASSVEEDAPDLPDRPGVVAPEMT